MDVVSRRLPGRWALVILAAFLAGAECGWLVGWSNHRVSRPLIVGLSASDRAELAGYQCALDGGTPFAACNAMLETGSLCTDDDICKEFPSRKLRQRACRKWGLAVYKLGIHHLAVENIEVVRRDHCEGAVLNCRGMPDNNTETMHSSRCGRYIPKFRNSRVERVNQNDVDRSITNVRTFYVALLRKRNIEPPSAVSWNQLFGTEAPETLD